MTTTATRTPSPTLPATRGRRSAQARTATEGRRAARVAALTLPATLALGVPVATLLSSPRDVATVDVVVSVLLVGGLEVVAARALWVLTRERSHPAAWAALLARVGYALLLVAGAGVLLARGAGGLSAFGDHWLTGLGVLGLHLVAVGVALWHSRIGGRIAPALVTLSGALAMAAALAPVDGTPLWAGLGPVVLGDLVLTALLARTVARRPGGLSPRPPAALRRRPPPPPP